MEQKIGRRTETLLPETLFLFPAGVMAHAAALKPRFVYRVRVRMREYAPEKQEAKAQRRLR